MPSPSLLRSRHGDRKTGFSLLELAIYTSILGIIGSSLSVMVVMVSRTTAEGKMVNEILERNRSAMRRIHEAYRRGLSSTVTVANNNRQLTFNLPGGFDGTSATTGDQIRFEILADPADPVNSVDDDGDGVIDEGILVFSNLTTGTTSTISHSINYATSSFLNLGWGIYVDLTHVGTTKESGKLTEVTKRLYFTSRN